MKYSLLLASTLLLFQVIRGAPQSNVEDNEIKSDSIEDNEIKVDSIEDDIKADIIEDNEIKSDIIEDIDEWEKFRKVLLEEFSITNQTMHLLKGVQDEDRLVNAAENEELSARVDELESEVNFIYSTSVVKDDLVVQRLRNGEIEIIKKFARRQPNDFYAIASTLFDRVINGRSSNVRALLQLIYPDDESLVDLTLSANLYPILYQTLNSEGLFRENLIPLAKHVYHCLNHQHFAQLSTDDRKKLSDFQTFLPRGVVGLIWDRLVLINSALHEDYYLNGREPGRLTTRPSSNNSALWQVQVSHDPFEVYFSFGNLESGLVFYSEETDVKLAANITSDSAYWKLLYIKDDDVFVFQNKQNKRILDVNNLEDCNIIIDTVEEENENKRKCSYVHAYFEYTKTDYQKWKIITPL